MARQIDDVLAGLGNLLPATLIRCGVGTAHAGASGLLASRRRGEGRDDRRAHMGARERRGPLRQRGLRRTLVEWYASDTAREAVATVLQPLTALGGARPSA